MRMLEKRGLQIGERMAGQRLRQLGLVLRERLPGASIEAQSSELHLSAPGLKKRWLFDPALRFLSRFR